jgi:hypothetical protein
MNLNGREIYWAVRMWRLGRPRMDFQVEGGGNKRKRKREGPRRARPAWLHLPRRPMQTHESSPSLDHARALGFGKRKRRRPGVVPAAGGDGGDGGPLVATRGGAGEGSAVTSSSADAHPGGVSSQQTSACSPATPSGEPGRRKGWG